MNLYSSDMTATQTHTGMQIYICAQKMENSAEFFTQSALLIQEVAPKLRVVAKIAQFHKFVKIMQKLHCATSQFSGWD